MIEIMTRTGIMKITLFTIFISGLIGACYFSKCSTSIINHDKCLSAKLFTACAKGNVGDIEKLIKEGADVNIQEAEGETPLMYAAAEGQYEAVRLLLRYGVNIQKKSKNNQTALGRASQFGYPTIVQALLDAGANVEEAMDDGGTPLMYADKLDVVKILLKRGADVSAQDYSGMTALISASAEGRSSIVAELLKHGANVNQKDRAGKTALTWAIERRQYEIIHILKSSGGVE